MHTDCFPLSSMPLMSLLHAFPGFTSCLLYSRFFFLFTCSLCLLYIDKEEECNVDMVGEIAANLALCAPV
jgi:hypothetical protein